MEAGGGWDRGDGPAKSEPQKTIIVAQPVRRRLISNDEPLTDEYLDSVLPSVGFKIIPPPPGYAPAVRVRKKEEEVVGPRLPREFEKLFSDLRADDELPPDERKERIVMRLILQLKEGTPYQRKLALRSLTGHATDFGADLIFRKIIPLLSSSVLSEQERHSLVKAVDRLMQRLADKMDAWVPPLLAFAGKMLLDNDSIARGEAREIVSNLAKISGFSVVITTVRSGLDSDDKTVREITARTIATTATAIGMNSSVFAFLNALIHTKKSWKIRHTGVRAIDSIAFQNGSGILPFLRELVGMVTVALGDEERVVVGTAMKCITTLAKAVAPFGGDAFTDVIPVIWDGINGQGRRRPCMKALVAVLMTVDVAVAARHFRELIQRVVHENYGTMTASDKMLRIEFFLRVLEKSAYDRESLGQIQDVLFSQLWNLKTVMDTKVGKQVVAVTVEVAKRSSLSFVLELLFNGFRTTPPYYRDLVLECLLKILQCCSTATLLEDQLRLINDNIILALDDVGEKDEKKGRFYMKVLAAFVSAIGERSCEVLEMVGGHIEDKLKRPGKRDRQQAAEMLAIYAKPYAMCGRKRELLHFYGVFQEFLGADYPDVLAAVLDAINEITNLLPTEELNPPPDDIAGRLVPILKNRHNRVSYSCVSLITSLSAKSPGIIHNKEWMRICFELLELLKADRRKVRTAAINAFACIAKAIGPFDVLLALLNNLQVQERQIRLCTTSAIAVLAEKCGPHIVLPALMNEYRTPDVNVQNGTLKAIQYLFQSIGRQSADYAYAVTPLITHALIERDAIHRQIACLVVKNFALGCFASGKEDALVHLLNHLMPNVFESTLHFIDAVMDAIDALRVSLGPGIILNYVIAGLFHPARKVRSQFWRIYNNLVIYSGDALVPYYPILTATNTNNYHRDELDVFV